MTTTIQLKNETGHYLRWVNNITETNEIINNLNYRGEELMKIPDGAYEIIEENDEHILVGIMLDSGCPSSKHRYLIEKNGGK
jgi:hypothetical protein